MLLRKLYILFPAVLLPLAACGGEAVTAGGGDGGADGRDTADAQTLFYASCANERPMLGTGVTCDYLSSQDQARVEGFDKNDCNGTLTYNPCPSAGLVGCCVEVVGLANVGTCYYVPTTDTCASCNSQETHWTTSPNHWMPTP
jgi:hypothetical protein